ncbi:hypothetical protein WSM22_37950 [Cytophagales bacterium WSM2-2]|nr:hypothetical protein WSM22_37950 [Cytophagales bacterium WSM2-2]
MKKFIVERVLPGAGKLTPAELKEIAKKSCAVIDNMPSYYWIETFVTDNKLYCVHIAPDKEDVYEHARQGGFPADHVAEVQCMIDPTTSVK